MINRTVTILLESATSSEKERAKQIPINVTKISNLPTFVMPIRGLSHSSKKKYTCMHKESVRIPLVFCL